MSRRRKRIAAATLLTVSVLGLGLAGYIGATNASGKDTFASERYPSGFHRYRLNHQIGTGTSAYAWSDSSEADAGHNVYAGSATPENEVADAKDSGTSDANGAGAGAEPEHAPSAPAPGASGTPGSSGGEQNWTPSSFRLAGSYGPGYRSGGGGSGGSQNQPGSNNTQNGNTGDGNNDTKPTDETPTQPDEPKTDPKDPTDPKGPTNPDPAGPGGPHYPPGGHPGDEHPTGDKPVSVPEPATLGLLGFGIAALGYMRRRRATAA